MQIPVGYVTPIPDRELPVMDFDTIIKYRRRANEWGYSRHREICFRVHADYGLLTHALESGACVDNFAGLRKTLLVSKPTIDCLVFWIPLIVPGSTAKTCKEQMNLLRKIRRELGLPRHHMANFGQASLIACLAGYYKSTVEKTFLNYDCVRTRNPIVVGGGPRLCLGESAKGSFQCFSAVSDDQRDSRVGIFAMGVEVLPGYMLPGGKK